MRPVVPRYFALILAILAQAASAQQSPEDPGTSANPEALIARGNVFSAAADGELELVKYFLEHGASVNSTDTYSRATPLVSALSKDRADIASYLLDNDADVKLADRTLSTPLHWAAHWGRRDLAERILDLGADINAANSEGRRPLHLAIRRGHVDLVKLLIARGADVNAVSGFDNAPIDLALEQASPDAATLLIDAGARLVDTPARANARMSTAAKKNWTVVIQALLDQSKNKPNLLKRLSNTAFDAAIGSGADTPVALADISDRSVAGFTRLFQAAMAGNEPMAKRALDDGLDPDEPMKPSGWTSLHAAVLGRDADIVAMLVQHGADSDAVDGLGRTPLHLAAMGAMRPDIKLLLEHGADPNATDFLGRSPLHYAAFAGDLVPVRALVAAGASIEALDSEGLSPFVIAQRNGHVRLLDQLKLSEPEPEAPPMNLQELARDTASDQTGPAFDRQLAMLLPEAKRGVPLAHLAIALESETALRHVLESDPDALKHRDPGGYLPIHLAAESRIPTLLTLVLDRNPDVNDAQNPAGWTPLHFAAAAGNQSAASELRKRGADPSLPDASGRTPADIAALAGHDELGLLLN